MYGGVIRRMDKVMFSARQCQYRNALRASKAPISAINDRRSQYFGYLWGGGVLDQYLPVLCLSFCRAFCANDEQWPPENN